MSKEVTVGNLFSTQGNYATQDSSGMRHEWREEKEQAFVHLGSLRPNEDLDNTVLVNVKPTIWSHYKVMDDTGKLFGRLHLM